jgi:hypothetical protein
VSRPTITTIQPGDALTAASLNTPLSALATATGSIDAANVRDQALDLPQFDADTVTQGLWTANLGELSIDHSTYNTVSSYTGATYPTPVEVVDFSLSPTRLIGPIPLATNQVLRVYWSLQVSPEYLGTPWNAAGSYSNVLISPATAMATSATVWLAWLQWCLEPTLTTWTEVPNQDNFDTNISGSIYGGPISNSASLVPIPAWIERADGAKDGELGAGSMSDQRIGWRGVSGCYYVQPLAGVTVYGLRVVLAGMAHPYRSGSTNHLVWDANAGGAGQVLHYTSGVISAITHTLG